MEDIHTFLCTVCVNCYAIGYSQVCRFVKMSIDVQNLRKFQNSPIQSVNISSFNDDFSNVNVLKKKLPIRITELRSTGYRRSDGSWSHKFRDTNNGVIIRSVCDSNVYPISSFRENIKIFPKFMQKSNDFSTNQSRYNGAYTSVGERITAVWNKPHHKHFSDNRVFLIRRQKI